MDRVSFLEARKDGDEIVVIDAALWQRMQRYATTMGCDEADILNDALALEKVYIEEVILRKSKMLIQQEDGTLIRITSPIDVRRGRKDV